MKTPKLSRLWCGAAALLLAVTNTTAPARADAAGMEKYGIADHPQRYSDYQAACDEIIASGIKWVRISPEWGGLEPSSGAYDAANLARLDGIVNRLTSNGVNVLFILCYTAPWASSNPSSPDASRYKPANWSDWGNYVSFITTRYKNKIFDWEVWNEPDHAGFWKSTPQDYVTLLQTAATAIRQTDPGNNVVLGGLAMHNGTSESFGLGTFFDTILGAGAAGSFDTVNYHAYGDSPRYVRLYNSTQAVLSKYGLQNRRIWITETGYTTVGDPTKEANKADMVDQTYLTHTSLPNVDKVFWYVHRNPIVTGNASESNFGLIANNRTPLKALYHYQASGGADTDFVLQANYPTQTPTRRTLYYYPATSGDGASVVNYAADGSTKRIPTNRYMYFRVNDDWLYDGNGGLDSKVFVDVTYLDSGTGNWVLQYDANSNAYYGTGLNRVKTNTNTWKTETFTLNDVKFANRQNYSTDFRIYASTADLMVAKVVVRKEMNVASVILGTTDRFRMAERPNDTNTSYEAYNPVATVGGREARQITANGKFIYMKVSDGIVRSGQAPVYMGIRFWDAGTDSLLLQYNATGGVNYKAVTIAKTNTNTWRYVTLTLNDADFRNAQNYSADFRISNGFDNSVESVSEIDVWR